MPVAAGRPLLAGQICAWNAPVSHFSCRFHLHASHGYVLLLARWCLCFEGMFLFYRNNIRLCPSMLIAFFFCHAYIFMDLCVCVYTYMYRTHAHTQKVATRIVSSRTPTCGARFLKTAQPASLTTWASTIFWTRLWQMKFSNLTTSRADITQLLLTRVFRLALHYLARILKSCLLTLSFQNFQCFDKETQLEFKFRWSS